MIALALACALWLPQAPNAPEPRSEDFLAALAPVQPIAGLAGFQSTSTVVYDAAPERPHLLETTYVFPGRVRWHLSVRGEDPSVRHVEYRCAEAFFELGQGTHRSTYIAPAAAVGLTDPWTCKCAASELRRALFLWPDGFEWRDEGSRTAALTKCGIRIEARLLRGRPVLIEARLADGSSPAAIDGYRDVTWRESRGRWWPASMKLEHFGQPVWTETVDAVETSVHLLDEYFVPPDRRRAASSPVSGVLSTDAAAAVVKRIELPASCDWARARELFAAHAGAELPKLAASGWRADPNPWFELGDDGRPRSCVLTLFPAPLELPVGWEFSAESTALVLLLANVDADLGQGLRALRAAVPEGTRAGRPLVRLAGAPVGGAVRLVLPLAPSR